MEDRKEKQNEEDTANSQPPRDQRMEKKVKWITVSLMVVNLVLLIIFGALVLHWRAKRLRALEPVETRICVPRSQFENNTCPDNTDLAAETDCCGSASLIMKEMLSRELGETFNEHSPSRILSEAKLNCTKTNRTINLCTLAGLDPTTSLQELLTRSQQHETQTYCKLIEPEDCFGFMLFALGIGTSMSTAKSNEVKSSYHMELDGLQRGLAALHQEGIGISEIVTDRHMQIAKWLRENLPKTRHSFDVWHVAKAVKKKLLALSKEKDCASVSKWIKSISNHIYWAAASSAEESGEMIVSKWKSVAAHVQNIHCGHEGPFEACIHQEISGREWIKTGADSPLHWKSVQSDNYSYLQGKVYIKETGHYFVHSQIKLSPPEVAYSTETSDNYRSLTYIHNIQHFSHLTQSTRTLLENMKSHCRSTRPGLKLNTTMSTGAVVFLEKRDHVYVTTSHPGHLVPCDLDNRLSLYMMQ